jgi:DNA modification methylase
VYIGNEHFAIFPEDLIARIVNFATQKGDWILDPFTGRGTTGIVSAFLGRNFTGIDLYPENVVKAEKNISDAVKGKLTVKLEPYRRHSIREYPFFKSISQLKLM